MRIIAGLHKGRIILAPKGIRPTEGIIRKALFDILGDIEGLLFLELFAGSGAVGFEAVSRGVKELILVEINRDCQAAIKKNIAALQLKNCHLLFQESESAIKALARDKRQFDIVFLDPPYYKGKAARSAESLTKKTLQILAACDILAPTSLVVAQHFKKDSLPDSAGDLSLYKQASYGDTVLSFYKRG